MCVYRESLLIQPYVWYKPQRCSRVADRFFISVFSAFRKEILESSGSHRMENGKLNVAQLYCCGHGDASVFGNAPAARVRDLCNESVSVAAVENARGFGTPTFRIGDAVQVRGVFEYVPDVRIGEAADHVLACQQGAEDLDLVAGNGIEGFGGPLGNNLLSCRDAVQGADGVGGIVDLGQGVEIPAVGGQGDILVTK